MTLPNLVFRSLLLATIHIEILVSSSKMTQVRLRFFQVMDLDCSCSKLSKKLGYKLQYPDDKSAVASSAAVVITAIIGPRTCFNIRLYKYYIT